MKVLILGSTGLVGKHVMQRALADDRITEIIAPTRRQLAPHPKLFNPVAADLADLLPAAADWVVDAVICAMGTTIGKAGSKEAFRHVDYVLPIAFSTLAHRTGADTIALVSSPGASLSIPLFYCRVKGEAERDMQGIGFKSVTIVRPGMIGGHRQEFRLAERVIMPLASLLRPLLPKPLRINPAINIADVLIEAAVTAKNGVRLVTSRELI
ncbi:Rossmann-fold NAD(P)-binding domain-containing protein [Herbaspirillum autotrophicum]|uniref:NAD-dependent dehydratase n=1 Tax=Herbaspirillum autotrophicum TaxID=180195 RepID=UPI00067E06B5|nr:NAD-dependent dehydratase [Herbaspirillum autotrophicum]